MTVAFSFCGAGRSCRLFICTRGLVDDVVGFLQCENCGSEATEKESRS